MAPGLTLALTVLLIVPVSFGSLPGCRMTSSTDGHSSVECDGPNYAKELIRLLTRPRVADVSKLTLSSNSFSVENITASLCNVTGLSRLKHLNLSSNDIRELFDMTCFDRLEELDLSNNSLSQVDFGFIPTTIRAVNLHSNHIRMDSNVTLPMSLKHLDLSDNHMTKVRPILSETLLRLNLSGNNISDLSFVLTLITTEELDLSTNNISQLEDDTFSTLSSLVRLDLSKNFIESLKEKSFSGLNRLQIIDLSGNLLRSITPGTFQYLSNLLWLNLANNTNLGNLDAVDDSSILLGAGHKLQTVDASRTNLTKVPNTLTRSIRNLYLSSNRISTIRCGDLDSFLLLQFLDLTSNNISIVEDDAFGRLELLYYLLLAENSLDSIPHSLPDNLLVLDLDHNRIQNLTSSDFFGLSKLRTLRLAWNVITIIQDGAFGQMSSLENLDLSGNPIRILSGSTFVGPRRLINLGLASLKNILPTNDTLSFPVPESSHLQILNLENSPALVVQLMNDVAALSMFRHINVLNLAFSNTERLRPDLVNFFPRLEILDLRGNRFDCNDTIWLSDWLRRLRDETSDESKLQLLEENASSPIDNRTDFDVTQDVRAYADRLYAAPADDLPKCAFPDHMYGVSLYDLQGPATTTPLQPRYDRTHFNIRQPHDHEFYQNDFPSPVSEQKVRQETTTLASKPLESDGRQTKRNNTAENVFLRSNIAKTNKHLDKTVRLDKKETFINTVKNVTEIGRDNIKAEYLRSDNKLTLNQVENKTNTNKNVSIADKELSIYSPLDVTSHEMDDENERPDSSDPDQSPESELSISSPQKITVDDDSDAAKELPDDDDDDDNANEERYTHHPGLLLFFVAASILGVTALAMRASQRRQSRHGYAQQQDIEVRSLDLSAQELW